METSNKIFDLCTSANGLLKWWSHAFVYVYACICLSLSVVIPTRNQRDALVEQRSALWVANDRWRLPSHSTSPSKLLNKTPNRIGWPSTACIKSAKFRYRSFRRGTERGRERKMNERNGEREGRTHMHKHEYDVVICYLQRRTKIQVWTHMHVVPNQSFQWSVMNKDKRPLS